jgi:hypothetical protein
MMALAALLFGGGSAVSADSGSSAEPTPAELEAMGLDEPMTGDPGPTTVPGSSRAVVAADVVLQDGDAATGGTGTVDTLNTPFVEGNGFVGFVGDVIGDDSFVWYNAGVVWQNSSAVGSTLTGGESTMGVDNTGGFIYSPSTDGDDSVWTDSGLLAVENVQAPGYPAGTNSTFHSRPTMIPTGQAYWVAGIDPSGGTTTNARALYTSTDGTPGTIAVVLKSGDIVDGLTISSGSSGILFDYDFSDDGSHHIHELDMDTGSTTNDGAVYVDGSLVARESLPTGGADNWDNFDYFSINNSGDYLFSGDTDGSTTTDEFVAYNGAIAIREGDTVGGVVLSSFSLRGVAINNLGHAAFVGSAGGVEQLFFACDAADLAATAELILAVGDQLDVDGGGADATVTDFNTSFHGLSLADDGRVFVELDIDYGSGDLEAIVGLDLPSCSSGPAMNEIRIDQPSTDNDEFFELYGTPGASLDGLTYIVIGDGTGGSGIIEEAVSLTGQTVPGSGFFVAAESTFTLGTADLTTSLNFENSDNVTHLLVEGFSGSVGDDLDTDDDCILETTPWTAVTDGVALIEEANPPTGTECEYATGLGLPTVGPDGSFVPGLTGRDPDGTGPWVIGPFDILDGGDTPGASNNGTIPVELMGFSVE